MGSRIEGSCAGYEKADSIDEKQESLYPIRPAPQMGRGSKTQPPALAPCERSCSSPVGPTDGLVPHSPENPERFKAARVPRLRLARHSHPSLLERVEVWGAGRNLRFVDRIHRTDQRF